MERIGVIGLGRMGGAMARKLAGQGAQVTGWTRSGRAVEGVVKDNEVFRRVAESYGVPSEALEHAATGQARQIAEGLGELDPAAGFAAAYRNA
jgi:3-hydroxyisobutyrate dehydrogenase